MPMTQDEANDFYGADAREWLRRWGEGRGVWSVEMGGLGPGYEQALQITATRIVRYLIDKDVQPDAFEEANWQATLDAIEKDVETGDLGLSGAQWGAAMNIALNIYRRGPAACMTDEKLEQDRKIQISKNFPTESTAAA